MTDITRTDVTFILKVGDIDYDADGVISKVQFVYRGDYGEHNWGVRQFRTFGLGDATAAGFTALASVTKAQVSEWVLAELSVVPDIDIELFRMNPDQDLTGITLPSEIDNLQRYITTEINAMRSRPVEPVITTGTLPV